MPETEQKVTFDYPEGFNSPIAVDVGVLTQGLSKFGIALPQITFQRVNTRYPGTLGLSSTFGGDVFLYTDLIFRSCLLYTSRCV